MPTKKISKNSKRTKSLSKTLTNLSPTPGSPGGPRSSQMKSYGLIFIVLGLIAITINISAILWIYKLENIDCKCSNNWMRIYIKYYLLIIIPIMVLTLFINVYLYTNNMEYSDIKSNLLSLYFFIIGGFNIFGFLNIIISIIFINKLKEINCDCSEDIKREVYYIYNIIMASLICLTILMFLMSIPIAILRLK
jgi:NhaP-type Na+/H+ or K+/H+ antiporter